MRREAIEVVSLGLLIAAYALFREYIAGRAVFIVPGSLVCVGYATYMIRSGGASLAECGIGPRNLKRASALTAVLFIPACAAILLLAKRAGTLGVPASFFLILPLYPLWGLVQQFIFQSFLHTRLIRLGLAPWSVVIVAAAFSVVHLGSPQLALFTFFAGIVASGIFLAAPNVIPLGIAHGLLGGMVFYMLYGTDLFNEFVK